jgi:hypothetical protein
MIKAHHARLFEAVSVALIAAIALELCAWGLGAQMPILWASWLAAIEFAALAPCYMLFLVAEGQSWHKSFADTRSIYLAAAFFAANAIADSFGASEQARYVVLGLAALVYFFGPFFVALARPPAPIDLPPSDHSQSHLDNVTSDRRAP